MLSYFECFSYICYVKLFWTIFSIYILVLSTAPCGDESNCNEFAETHTNITANASQDGSHQDEICSPFCMCSCCGCQGFHIEPFLSASITFSQSIDKKITPYESQFLSQFTANIWQPPKLG